MRFFSAVNSPRVNDHPTFLMRVCCITQRAQRNGSFALPLSSCYEAWLDKYTKCLQFVLEFFPMSISGGLLMLNFSPLLPSCAFAIRTVGCLFLSRACVVVSVKSTGV